LICHRLGWAADYRDGFHAKKDGFMKSVQPPHAQIHITFASMHGKIVTESALRDIFERFGEVKDVSIKKIHFSRVS
jgi:RNA recognition motif-containing protein